MDRSCAMRRLRAATHRTLDEFAKPLGVTGGRINQIEHGQGGLRDGPLRVLVRVYAPEIADEGIKLIDFLTPPRHRR